MKKKPMCDVVATGLARGIANFEVTRVDSDTSYVTKNVCSLHLARIITELTSHNKNFVTVRRYLDEKESED